ncbi:MAG: FHA domain-containing protein [Candidatus Aramenus sp.]|nr:FHA domain-containing protein [Candidatus Aramenus sp.]
MTWKCPVCGYENADDALFCIQCGAKRPEGAQQPQAQPAEAPQPAEVQAPQQVTVDQQAQQEAKPAEPQTEAQPASPTVASTEPVPQAIQQTTPQPPTAQLSQQVEVQQQAQKYYLQFIATPASALNKMKVPLDFDVFENISIGRSPENVIVIPDSEVSRRHAVLSLSNGKLYIEDLNSTNGTYVYDGKLFQPVKGKQEIQANSIIKLGNSTIVKIVRE